MSAVNSSVSNGPWSAKKSEFAKQARLEINRSRGESENWDNKPSVGERLSWRQWRRKLAAASAAQVPLETVAAATGLGARRGGGVPPIPRGLGGQPLALM